MFSAKSSEHALDCFTVYDELHLLKWWRNSKLDEIRKAPEYLYISADLSRDTAVYVNGWKSQYSRHNKALMFMKTKRGVLAVNSLIFLYTVYPYPTTTFDANVKFAVEMQILDSEIKSFNNHIFPRPCIRKGQPIWTIKHANWTSEYICGWPKSYCYTWPTHHLGKKWHFR